MNSVERIKRICKERKISIAKLERDCGFANGYIGQLRKGMLPADRLKTVSKYLNISINELLGEDEQKESAIFSDDAFSNEELWLINMWRKATLDDKDIVRMLLRKYDVELKKEIV